MSILQKAYAIEVSLEEVLHFREEKALVQLQMHEEGSEAIVVSLGMNIPGPIKCSPLIEEAFYEGVHALEKVIEKADGEIVQKRLLEERAGYAAVYLVKSVDGLALKRKTTLLEESHTLGRIWDVDIIGKDGIIIERESVGMLRRRCLLCGQDTKVCGRSRSHEVEVLQDRVKEIISEWKKKWTEHPEGKYSP